MRFEPQSWQAALEKAAPDPVVGIRIAPLCGDATLGLYVASIPDRVGCHFHRHGGETYQIMKGAGTLHLGMVDESESPFSVQWEVPVPVEQGDCFLIPAGCAHQLRRSGASELVIVFACPPSHLSDIDRTMVDEPS